MVNSGVSAERPVQDDSEVPSVVAALRLDVPGWTGAYASGSAARVKLVPASFSVSGKVNTFSLPGDVAAGTVSKTTLTSGETVAFTTLIPVIPATDKSFMTSLVLTGEYTNGSGDAEEFSSWSGGQGAFATNAAATGVDTPNLDAGFGGYYAGSNTFQLMNLQTFNAAAQYQLPSDWATYFNAGYSQLYCDNLNAMNANALSGISNGYNQVSGLYGNVSHDWSNSLRTSFEYDHFTTTYLSKANGYAVDNRLMLSFFYLM
jgi:hypothetical protein